MMPTSLFVVVAMALDLAHGSSMLDRPSMLCEANGITSLSSPMNPANPRNKDFQICYPTSSQLDSPARRSLESRDADINNQSAGIRRLQDFFNATFDFSVSRLPFQHTMEVAPWPGSIWAASKDGINYRWDSKEPSPSEKYAMAFGKNVRDMQDLISSKSGVDSYSTNPKCTIKPGEELKQGTCATGSVCSTRRGELYGYCIDSSEGISHAWAPASMLEPEPQCAVTKNDVKFEVKDIKGLLTQVYYDSAEITIFTGARFKGNDTAPENAAKDQYGRFLNKERRDLSPGFFHLAVTNVLGTLNKTLIMDVVAGSKVKNRVILSFDILEAKLLQNLAEAAQTYFKADHYLFNNEAYYLLYVKNRVQYVGECDVNGPLVDSGKFKQYVKRTEYEYLLELDKSKNVIGGEWVGNSRDEHPDFLWVQMSKPQDDFVAPSSGIQYGHVRQLLEESINNCTQTHHL